MILDTRHVALNILLGCHKKNCTLDQSLDYAQTDLDRLSRQDRNLCHALVFGVLRQRGYLDFIIKSFSTKPLEKTEVNILYILRMGLFQLFFLDRIPAFAAINTSIDLAKTQTSTGAAGFINALLRSVQRAREETRQPGHEFIALPDPQKHLAAHIQARFSLPGWLVKRWLAAHGKEKTLGLCQTLNTLPPLTLRVNTLKTDRKRLRIHLEAQGFEVEPTEHSPHGLSISSPGKAVTDIEGFQQGWFQIQDEAAQLVSYILDPRPHETILDACAGLGGKTCHMAQLMENTGSILAVDSQAHKLESLAQEAQRLGINNIQTQQIDLLKADIRDFPGYFDRVLVDAPCSGLGVIRRNPDTKWKRDFKDVLRLSALQKKILNSGANLVKPGGILVYAVCSCEPEENEQVVQAFLKKRKDYSLDPGFDSPLKTSQDFFKTYPDHIGMDGFFAARLKRAEKT